MHDNARQQLGLTPSGPVNGGAGDGASGHGGGTPTAEDGASRAADLVGTALTQASGWVARRGQPSAPAVGVTTGAWLVRAAFGLFSVVVLASFVVIAIGLMSVGEATTLLMPVAVMAAMAIGIFLGDRRA